LLFRHTEGGVAKIDLYKEKELLRITKTWWHDDYEKGTRSIKSDSFEPITIKQSLVINTLTTALNEILSWKLNNWDSNHSGFKKVWHGTWSKKQFYELEKQYPLPSI